MYKNKTRQAVKPKSLAQTFKRGSTLRDKVAKGGLANKVLPKPPRRMPQAKPISSQAAGRMLKEAKSAMLYKKPKAPSRAGALKKR